MATKKKRKGKRSALKASIGMLKGLTLSWSSYDPLKPLSEQEDDDITETSYSHSNYIYSLMAAEIMRDGKHIIHGRRLKWRVFAECEFKDSNGKAYFRATEMVIHAVLNDADGCYQQAVEDVFSESNMHQYIKTNVTCTILGDCGIKDNDFIN